MSKETKVINFFGAPGAGKSTAAAELFALMKREYISCELVTEFAKDLIYSGNEHRLRDQDYVFAEQHHRISRLMGKVDFIISDSPLFLQAFYKPDDYPEEFSGFAIAMAKRYPSINIFISRNHPYDPAGRVHTEAESDKISGDMMDFMCAHDIKFRSVVASEHVAREILGEIKFDLRRNRNGFGRP